jgi:hypothetical protein
VGQFKSFPIAKYQTVKAGYVQGEYWKAWKHYEEKDSWDQEEIAMEVQKVGIANVLLHLSHFPDYFE